MNKKILLFAILICAVPLLALSNKPLQKIKLQLKWTHQFQFAGYYMAKEMGYYRDVGFDVDIIEATPGINPAEEVAAGRAEFGVHNTALLIDRYRGMKIVALAAMFQHSPLALMSLDDGRIKNIHDLGGKKIMLSHADAELVGMLKREGISPSEYEKIETTLKLQDLISGKVDAFSVYISNQPFIMDTMGIKYKLFMPNSYGIDFYGDILFTSEAYLQNNKEAVDRFVKASTKGWEYALSHTDESIEITHSKYATSKDKKLVAYEAAKTIQLVTKDYVPIGFSNEGRWRHIADTYADMGLLPKNYPLEGFLYAKDAKQQKIELLIKVVAAVVFALLLLWGAFVYLSHINKRLKKEQQKNELIIIEQSKRVSIGALIGNISHQWRHPLNKISLVVANIKGALFFGEKIDEGGLTKQLDMIERAITMMESTIAQFNGFYAHKDTKEEFAPFVVMNEMLELLGENIQKFKVEIKNEIDPSIRLYGYKNAAANCFLSILQNSVENFGLKKMANPAITIDSTTAVKTTIKICDNGGGIQGINLNDAFEPFMTTKEQGTGMGLAIVRTLMIKKLNGNATAYNTTEGVCFELEFGISSINTSGF